MRNAPMIEAHIQIKFNISDIHISKRNYEVKITILNISIA